MKKRTSPLGNAKPFAELKVEFIVGTNSWLSIKMGIKYDFAFL